MKRKNIPLICIAVLFIGCEQKLYSPELTEPAIVEDTVFQTSQHGSGTGISLPTGKGSVGVAFVNVDIPPKWAIVFHCQHGKFVIEGSSERHERLWNKLSKGDNVTVRYKEITAIRNDRPVLIGYDFIDANKQ